MVRWLSYDGRTDRSVELINTAFWGTARPERPLFSHAGAIRMVSSQKAGGRVSAPASTPPTTQSPRHGRGLTLSIRSAVAFGPSFHGSDRADVVGSSPGLDFKLETKEGSVYLPALLSSHHPSLMVPSCCSGLQDDHHGSSPAPQPCPDPRQGKSTRSGRSCGLCVRCD